MDSQEMIFGEIVFAIMSKFYLEGVSNRYIGYAQARTQCPAIHTHTHTQRTDS